MLCYVYRGGYRERMTRQAVSSTADGILDSRAGVTLSEITWYSATRRRTRYWIHTTVKYRYTIDDEPAERDREVTGPSVDSTLAEEPVAHTQRTQGEQMRDHILGHGRARRYGGCSVLSTQCHDMERTGAP